MTQRLCVTHLRQERDNEQQPSVGPEVAGFVSANIHAALIGPNVANYAAADVRTPSHAPQSPKRITHGPLAESAQFDPVVYLVADALPFECR